MSFPDSFKFDQYDMAHKDLGQVKADKIYRLNICSDKGYIHSEIHDKDWKLDVTCYGHNLNAGDNTTWSRMVSNNLAKSKGHEDRNALALATCREKGFNNIKADDWKQAWSSNVNDDFAEDDKYFRIRCTEPKSSMDNLTKGSAIKCIEESGGAIYRLNDDYKTINHYPSPEIAASYGENLAVINHVVCSALNKGAPLEKKTVTIPAAYRYKGNNGSVTGATYCAGGWEGCEGKDKNLSCIDGIDMTTGDKVGCDQQRANVAWNCSGVLPGKTLPVCRPSSSSESTSSANTDTQPQANTEADDAEADDAEADDAEADDAEADDTEEDESLPLIPIIGAVVVIILIIILLLKKK